MPYRPKHPCAFPGCPRLTDKRFCEVHRKLEDKRYNEYCRDKSHAERYDAHWKKIRDAYIAQHPLCERCLAEGRYTPAGHVHHIIPLKEGGTNDADNLMAVCHSCHSHIHAERGDYWGKKPGGKKKERVKREE